jgi:hypothetical protein
MSISAIIAHSNDKNEKRLSPHIPGDACPNEVVDDERGAGLRVEEDEVETLE